MQLTTVHKLQTNELIVPPDARSRHHNGLSCLPEGRFSEAAAFWCLASVILTVHAWTEASSKSESVPPMSVHVTSPVGLFLSVGWKYFVNEQW